MERKLKQAKNLRIRNMIKSRFFFLLLVCIFSLNVQAVLAERQYYFRTLDINNGLSQNTVYDIIQDRTGFLWFATANGLNRYDGLSFQVFVKENGGLGNNFVTALYEDASGQIWVGTDDGVYIYTPETESFRYFDMKSDLGTTMRSTVSVIQGDEQGNVWISVSAQGLFCYNPITDKLREIKIEDYKERLLHASSLLFLPDGTAYIALFGGGIFYSNDKFKTMHSFKDPDGNDPFANLLGRQMTLGRYNRLYVGTNKAGLLEIDLSTNKVRSLLQKDENGDALFVREIVEYSDDELWIGTESGLYIYNTRTGQSVHLMKQIGDAYSLSDNAIYSIIKDQEGAMWIGSYFGGVNYYPKQYSYFEKLYPKDMGMDEVGQRVREIVEDNSGNLWIGTEDKGLFCYDPVTRTMKAFQHPSIYHNVHGLCLDDNYLWVGTFSQGLNRIDLRTKSVKAYLRGDNSSPQSVKVDHIFTICRLASGDMLMGCPNGMIRYDRAKDDFSWIPELKGIFFYDILEDSDGNIWGASYARGVFRLNVHTGKWESFTHDAKDPDSLPYDRVLSVFEDSNRQIWFTTQGKGFCRFDPVKKGFVNYDLADDLAGNVVSRIVEDDQGLFWVTTNKGLVRFNPKTAEMKVYTTANGLVSNQFNYQSGYKDKNGTIYLGSIKGIVSFNPKTFTDNTFLPPVVITDFMIFDKKVTVGAEGSPLKESITTSKEIELAYDQNSFSFRIAALSYQAPEMNKLIYKMEGFDKEWYTAMDHNLVTYSNLPYGDYTLMIKGSNSDGVWNNDVRTLKIHVLPPFYLSVWAYLFYFALAIGGIVFVIIYFRKRSQLKHQMQMEKFEQEKEREFYTAKIDFFTNVAHEIRTPLTLIKSPLENILRKHSFAHEVETDLKIMDQNAERLLNLTNQLLDFRKTESGGFRLNLVENDIVALVERTFVRFTPLAKQKGLDFTLELPETAFSSLVDREALTKIISNLLTNALKYSSTYAHARLSVEGDAFCFKICNDGEVIPRGNREEIFQPFVRYKEGKNVATGTGIGLALARSLAEQHQGTLKMDDCEERNCFLLMVPIRHSESKEADDAAKPVLTGTGEAVEEEQVKKVNTGADRNRKPIVLVVEDNPDMLSFISRQLSEDYQLLTATNGLEGLKALEGEGVNLIVSDVMMPEMDGLELCERVKSDINSSHIPVILLTAKTSVQSKIEGLRTGADAYIEKPFSVEHLKANIDNLLNNREKLRQAFVNSPFISFNSMAMTKADELFIKALDEVMQAYISASDFSVDDLASAMNMSRSSLNRKIRGVLDMSPNDYIRIERLKKAACLLKEKVCKVNEVCYMVGFNTPSYFAKCFLKQFGVLPKDFE